jgi:hypothetical protein
MAARCVALRMGNNKRTRASDATSDRVGDTSDADATRAGATPKGLQLHSPGLPYSATLGDGAAPRTSRSWVAYGAVKSLVTFRCPREAQPPLGLVSHRDPPSQG